jgi:hypothetical protein
VALPNMVSTQLSCPLQLGGGCELLWMAVVHRDHVRPFVLGQRSCLLMELCPGQRGSEGHGDHQALFSSVLELGHLMWPQVRTQMILVTGFSYSHRTGIRLQNCLQVVSSST